MKAISRVLDCVREGFETSTDIAAETGLWQPSVSAHLSELEKAGLVRCIGRRRWRNKHDDLRTRYTKIYASKTQEG